MSWAGKESIRDYFKGLFLKKEQAPSIVVSSAPTPTVRLQPHTIERMDRLVEQWVNGKGYRMPDKTMEQAASRIGTDSVTLYRYFQIRGENFRSFRTRLRLEDACEQLKQEPHSTVSSIARRVGISDRANFCHQFKALYGITPDEWRKTRI